MTKKFKEINNQTTGTNQELQIFKFFKHFKTSCHRVVFICDKAQYGEATFNEKLRLNAHVLFCKICRLYIKQNCLLSKAYRAKALEHKTKKFKLAESDKQTLKQNIKELY